ncbi:hypothetical protein ATO12_02520 [Aquimarina atlantica]|uniref:Outer membrane protein beta-barrel domain-containing protein n=1 Tax=Aquimarina atlantica TaxID=1317122 RepID=A0A023C171_9FLAO|nr:hypothetical protein [Aquimarina atlantica]EZH75683.1 hypothetical protein ATO12_02520 [Aquimarina atlantica]
MRKYIFAILCIYGITLKAQEKVSNKKKNKLEFSTAYNFGVLKNLELAPVARYDYNGIVYKLSYERSSKNQNIFEVGVDFLGKTALKTDRLSNLNTELLKGSVNFSYLKQLYTKNSLSIHIGLQSQSNISRFFNRSDYVDVHQELGITSRFGYRLNEKQYLSSQITIPFVLGRVSSVNAGVYSFNRYQSISWNLKYGYILSDNFDIKASYDFSYNRLQIPIAYRELQHQLNLGIIYKF